ARSTWLTSATWASCWRRKPAASSRWSGPSWMTCALVRASVSRRQSIRPRCAPLVSDVFAVCSVVIVSPLAFRRLRKQGQLLRCCCVQTWALTGSVLGQALDKMPDHRAALPQRQLWRAVVSVKETWLGDATKVRAIWLVGYCEL